MLQLITSVLLVAMGAPTSGPPPGERMLSFAPSAVTDKTPLPPKIPDCRTDEQIQKALTEKANGLSQSCDPPKPRRAQRR